MEAKIKVELGDIQKTLLMPLWAIVAENSKPKPLLVDKKVGKVLSTLDYDFEGFSQNIPEVSQIAWIARSLRFDKITRNFIAKHENPVVVNVGCGLDTMYERIDSPKVTWYDVDLQDVIALRKELLPETDNHKYIAGSLLDTVWFGQISGINILFILKGVLAYFPENEAKKFILEVADNFRGAELFFDVTSPKGVEIANQVIIKSGVNTPSIFKWGIPNRSKNFSEWDPRIKLAAVYHTFRIRGLNLSLKNWITGTISDMYDIQYMVHLVIC